jgi:hypothetical protein
MMDNKLIKPVVVSLIALALFPFIGLLVRGDIWSGLNDWYFYTGGIFVYHWIIKDHIQEIE